MKKVNINQFNTNLFLMKAFFQNIQIKITLKKQKVNFKASRIIKIIKMKIKFILKETDILYIVSN